MMGLLCTIMLVSPAQSFSGQSPGGFMTIFYCLRFETCPNWRARSLYLHHPWTGWPIYIPRHWIPFSSPPTTRRVTVEVFYAASTRISCTALTNCPASNIYARTHRKHRASVAASIVACAVVGADRAKNTAFQPVHWRVLGICCPAKGIVYRVIT
jgi:hypothetical protein